MVMAFQTLIVRGLFLRHATSKIKDETDLFRIKH